MYTLAHTRPIEIEKTTPTTRKAPTSNTTPNTPRILPANSHPNLDYKLYPQHRSKGHTSVNHKGLHQEHEEGLNPFSRHINIVFLHHAHHVILPQLTPIWAIMWGRHREGGSMQKIWACGPIFYTKGCGTDFLLQEVLNTTMSTPQCTIDDHHVQDQDCLFCLHHNSSAMPTPSAICKSDCSCDYQHSFPLVATCLDLPSDFPVEYQVSNPK